MKNAIKLKANEYNRGAAPMNTRGIREHAMKRAAGRNRDRSGVALVIVLGFLAVLSIMAVGFAISMRVERLSSTTFYHGARAREFAQIGLARTLDRIDGEMLTNNEFYPARVVYLSDNNDPNWITGQDEPVPTLIGLAPASRQADAYIPESAFPTAAEINAVQWIPVYENPLDPNSTRIGRYAYLAVNCSGFLDANTIQREPARDLGKEPGEIQVNATLLSDDFANPGNVNTFLTDFRDDLWIRFETLAELNQVTPLRRPVHYLFPFSLFPVGYYDDTPAVLRAAQPLYIGINEDDPQPRDIPWSGIESRFEDMGLNQTEVIRNLRYYLGHIPTPRALESFATERIPMINEVVIGSELVAASPVELRLTLTVQVELWYPFVGSTANLSSYTISVTPQIVGGSDFILESSTPTATATGPWNATGTTDGQFANPSPTLTFTFSHIRTPDPVTGDLPPFIAPTSLRFTAFDLYEGAAGGTVVDRISTPFDVGWSDHLVSAPGSRESAWEVDDPRINWDWGATDSSGHWQSVGSSTLGAINSRASFNSAGKDGTWHMYVRGDPASRDPAVRQTEPLNTVGELGFLLYDESKPWRTIPLLGSDAVPVLDHFVLSRDRIRKGLVNLNSPHPAVLASAFLDMPVERWPGDGGVILNTASALDIANAIIAQRPYTNLSDISEANIEGALPGTPSSSHLVAEGIVRNSAGLLSPRQNLFTVVIAAQSLLGNEVMGERRAVAVVWRDPYETGPDGKNRAFIRFFRWLDE